MSEIALAHINTFGSTSPKADVQPSEEPVFALTSSQLREIVFQEVHEATKSLNSRIDALEGRIIQQSNELAALKATETENFRILTHDDRDIWEALSEIDRKITRTPSAPQGKKTLARIAKIEEILKTRGATSLKELERILGIDRATMTRLIGKLDMRRYEVLSRPGDDREKVLRLKVQIR